MRIVGIDEAGRGPVIGPLVVCGVCIDEKKLKNLERLGIKDSKKLSPKRRTILHRKIKKIFDYHVISISASDIDNLRSKDVNLNEIEKIAITKIISYFQPDLAIIDSVDVNPERFRNEIKEIVNEDIEIIAEHGADDKYLIVGAASIIAKVERDLEIAEIRKKFKDVGSGYPSDPKTQSFLKKYKFENLPDFVRKSWNTSQKLKDKSNK
ncbi:MAG: ribonuclease HII [Methanomicrobiales archaeon]